MNIDVCFCSAVFWPTYISYTSTDISESPFLLPPRPAVLQEAYEKYRQDGDIQAPYSVCFGASGFRVLGLGFRERWPGMGRMALDGSDSPLGFRSLVSNLRRCGCTQIISSPYLGSVKTEASILSHTLLDPSALTFKSSAEELFSKSP